MDEHMRWTTIDLPNIGSLEVQVDTECVTHLPTPDEYRQWVERAQANVAFELDRYVPWGCTDCDENGDGQDGDGADTAWEAVAHAISSLLWGGMTGSAVNHWCRVCKIEAFPADEDDGFGYQRQTMLTLRLKDGRIIEDKP